MAVVTLSISEFLGMFPHLQTAYTDGKINDTQITEAFNTVAEWLGNTENSIYPYNPEKGIMTRKRLLYFATCHLLTLGLLPAGQQGRLASASQGSVSTSFDLIHANGLTAQWWLQTPCGSSFWVMLQAYRKGGRVYAHKHFHPYG